MSPSHHLLLLCPPNFFFFFFLFFLSVFVFVFVFQGPSQCRVASGVQCGLLCLFARLRNDAASARKTRARGKVRLTSERREFLVLFLFFFGLLGAQLFYFSLSTPQSKTQWPQSQLPLPRSYSLAFLPSSVFLSRGVFVATGSSTLATRKRHISFLLKDDDQANKN